MYPCDQSVCPSDRTGESYQQDFTYQVERTVKTSGTRGNIYDCNGKLLAYNKLVYTVTFQSDDEFKDLARQNDTSEDYEKNKVIYKVIKILEKMEMILSMKSRLKLQEAENSVLQRPVQL